MHLFDNKQHQISQYKLIHTRK